VRDCNALLAVMVTLPLGRDSAADSADAGGLRGGWQQLMTVQSLLAALTVVVGWCVRLSTDRCTLHTDRWSLATASTITGPLHPPAR
jgi:hypothetical protein